MYQVQDILLYLSVGDHRVTLIGQTDRQTDRQTYAFSESVLETTSCGIYFFPSHLLYSPYLPVVTKINHWVTSKQRVLLPPPHHDARLHFDHEKSSALSSLVDSRPIVHIASVYFHLLVAHGLYTYLLHESQLKRRIQRGDPPDASPGIKPQQHVGFS